jgi:hypothetical protein
LAEILYKKALVTCVDRVLFAERQPRTARSLDGSSARKMLCERRRNRSAKANIGNQ